VALTGWSGTDDSSHISRVAPATNEAHDTGSTQGSSRELVPWIITRPARRLLVGKLAIAEVAVPAFALAEETLRPNSVALSLYQVVAVGVVCGLGAVGDAGLVEDVAHVAVHRVEADDELVRYMPVALALSDEAQHFSLALR
jgi:hypothetical protein